MSTVVKHEDALEQRASDLIPSSCTQVFKPAQQNFLIFTCDYFLVGVLSIVLLLEFLFTILGLLEGIVDCRERSSRDVHLIKSEHR